ncbi:T9SS type A sorting domain-containing protein, partial [Dolichospermum sp. ST_sed4]|nr:T9SS type A sorting domain-containing protein [Dolichospermum sp. ST_sed4]
LTNSVTYFWRVKAKNQSGWGAFSQWLRFVTSPLAVNTAGEIPEVFALYNNYPNPFNPITTIGFDIPKSSFVSLKVFDILGREVTSLVSENMEPGSYRVSF